MELRHSRACGNPIVVIKRPQFTADGCPGAPGMHRNCIQTCIKHALIVHSWCVPKTARRPPRHTTSARTSSFPRLRKSSCCLKAAPIQHRRTLWSPRNAPELHTNMRETCTGGAFEVRFEGSTALATGNHHRQDWIPACAGLTDLARRSKNTGLRNDPGQSTTSPSTRIWLTRK